MPRMGLMPCIVTGAFLPMMWFDLTRQLMALSALLIAYRARELASLPIFGTWKAAMSPLAANPFPPNLMRG